METKSKRPDVRVEPTLYEVLKEYCAKTDQSVAHYTRTLYVNDLRAKGELTPDHLRQMKGT